MSLYHSSQIITNKMPQLAVDDMIQFDHLNATFRIEQCLWPYPHMAKYRIKLHNAALSGKDKAPTEKKINDYFFSQLGLDEAQRLSLLSSLITGNYTLSALGWPRFFSLEHIEKYMDHLIKMEDTLCNPSNKHHVNKVNEGLSYGDLVQFNFPDKVIRYRVSNFILINLDNPRDKRAIFKQLGISKPLEISMKCYGYKYNTHLNNGWPHYHKNDFPAVTRLVKKLFEIIGPNENIEKMNEIMQLLSSRRSLISQSNSVITKSLTPVEEWLDWTMPKIRQIKPTMITINLDIPRSNRGNHRRKYIKTEVK